MPFVEEKIFYQFLPYTAGVTYGPDRLIDMAKYPKARAMTVIFQTDSQVDAPLNFSVVGNENSDQINGLMRIGAEQVSIASQANKISFSITVSNFPFPYYGGVIRVGPTAPSTGRVWADAYIWWDEDK